MNHDMWPVEALLLGHARVKRELTEDRTTTSQVLEAYES